MPTHIKKLNTKTISYSKARVKPKFPTSRKIKLIKKLNLNKMKTFKVISTMLLFGLFLMQSTHLYAQDPMVAASNVYKKVLLENDNVRVMQVVFPPGAVAPWHNHPNHTVYALTSGKIQITDKDKPASNIDIMAGTALYMPAVTHKAKNIGTTTIKLIVTEIKPTP
jgi:quercetin dioxygenase-like cupin family protein